MLSTTLLKTLDIAINRYVGLDPDTQHKLQQLSGSSVTVECVGLPKPLIFQLQLTQNKIHVSAHDPTLVTTTYIKGTPLGLCRLGLCRTPQGLVTKDVEISGDMELGQTIKTILDNMDIDWEGHLAKGIGDVAAHTVGNMARRVKRGLRKAADVTRTNASEFVTEEICLTPSKQELNDFFIDVDILRDDVARLALRIDRITINKEKD